MKKISTLLAASMLLSLAACGGKAGDILNKQTHGQEKAAQAELAFTTGIWKSGCVSTGLKILDLGIASEQTMYDVHTSGAMTRTTTYFAQSDCTNATANILEDISFNFGNQMSGDNYEFDMTFKNEKVTPLSDDAVKTMNSLTGYCNITNWSKDSTQDVSSQSGAITCPGVSKVGRTEYGVISITGSGNKEMYLSAGAPTPALRPQTADLSQKYSR